jgi:hypothetical protein
MMAEAASATAETASVVVGRLDTQVGTRRRPRSEKIARWMRFSFGTRNPFGARRAAAESWEGQEAKSLFT